MHSSRNAFTLIELSIVLLIISLIIGGVIGGKSLIESAKIQKFIADINSIKAAVNTFENKYNALPGDLRNATSYWDGTSNGNGDGMYPDSDVPFNSEGGYIFHHLGLAGMWDRYPRPNTTNYTYGEVNPSLLPNTAMVAQNRSLEPSTSQRHGSQRNYLQIGRWHTIGSNSNIQCGGMTSIFGAKLDKKMDDGEASRGVMLGYNHSCSRQAGLGNCATANWDAPAGTSDYDLSNKDETCRFAFQIFND